MRISDPTTHVLKRLHSLTGVVPAGLFLLWHLFANSYALHGPGAYDGISGFLARLPYVQLIELFGIALPILFHMVLGVVFVTTGQASLRRYPYAHHWMYVLQRLSGLALVPYIFYHVWATRLSPQVLVGDEHLFALMARQLANPWVFAFSVAGVISAAWHFGSGLFGFSIHWGIAIGWDAQRRMARLGFAVFVILSLVGVNSLLAFRHRSVRNFERAPEAAVISGPVIPARRSALMATPRIAVVGGGLAGLMSAIKIAEAGLPVELFSIVPVQRSHSVCAQGGINGAVNVKGENDSPEIHFVDTVRGGDFLAHQPPVRGMCYAAPSMIYLLDRMGVMFNRTAEGYLDFRRFGGTLYNRTAFAGATTGQQMLYALDEQVRRHEVSGLVTKYEGWEYLGMVRDESGRCVGHVSLDLRTMKPQAFRADAVLLCTGGPGLLFGRTTNSAINSGAAAGAAYREGVWYANGEFIQVHPTAIPGQDKLRLMSESARGEGGRIWVPRKQGETRDPRQIPEGERWYFLEEKYPRYGNLVPRDVASREIYDVCVNHGLGVGGKMCVYLDLTHIPAETLDRKLGGILEIYEKFAGEDPRQMPMKVFPAVHYSMGGLWVDYAATADGFPDVGNPKNHMTNVPGFYAVGEVDYQYHGANRLGANSLLSCIYGGMVAGPGSVTWAKSHKQTAADLPASIFAAAERRWTAHFAELAKRDGPENPFVLAEELGNWMLDNVTVVRFNGKLRETDAKVLELKERWKNTWVLDRTSWSNQPLSFLNQLENMLELARVVVPGALARDESRGSHYKPDYPKRDDAKWLKTTVVTYMPDGPAFRYDPVDTSLVPPVERKYD